MKKENNIYIIDADDITNNTAYTNEEVIAVLSSKGAFKAIANAVYRYIYNFYNKSNKYAHRKYMNHIIETNYEDAREGLKRAQIEMACGAIESGMDYAKYLEDQKADAPYTVEQELENYGLLDGSDKCEV